jgi:hypothetical protein
LGHRRKREEETVSEAYYTQFSERLRDEAASMATQYAIFYCLENSIREVIVQRLTEEYGSDWWTKVIPDSTQKNVVPESVQKNAASNQKREIETGVTPRSAELIDYTTFGELGEIIRNNWTILGDMFRDQGAVGRIMHNLNTLRGPIAHCKALAEDEVVRLYLSLRDLFRQME